MKKDKTSDYTKSTLFSFVIRVWTLHAVAFVASIILLTATAPLFGDTAGGIISCIVCTVLFAVFTYLEGWRTGSRDSNLIKYGRIDDDRFKGVKAAVISQIPGIVLAILMQRPAPSVMVNNFIRYFYMFFAYALQRLTQTGTAAYFVPALIPLATVIAGYSFGRRDIRIVNYIVYKRPGSDGDNR